MKKHGETPELTEEMWLDKRLIIATMSFAKPAECHCTQCDNWNGASFQVHTEVGTMKFKKSMEGLHHHEFSPEFINALKTLKLQEQHEAQLVATTEDGTEGHAKQQQERAKEARKS